MRIMQLGLVFLFYFSMIQASTTDRMHAVISFITGTDFHRAYFAAEYADTETQDMVREIMHLMGFDPAQVIHVLYLNEQGFSYFGVENAVAGTNTIFIDQEWFAQLSYAERQFILAHELAHIYYHHTKKMSCVVAGALSWLTYKMVRCMQNKEPLSYYLATTAAISVLLPVCSRFVERSADILSAKTLGSYEGARIFFDRIISEEIVEDSPWYKRWHTAIMRTHPCPRERLATLEALGLI